MLWQHVILCQLYVMGSAPGYVCCVLCNWRLSCTTHNTHTNIHTYVHTYIHIFTHTHTETHTFTVTLLLDSGCWPPVMGFAITLTGHTTLGRTLVNECSTPRRDLYLPTHDNHKRQTSMTKAEFERAIPESEWPQTNALDRAVAAIG